MWTATHEPKTGSSAVRLTGRWRCELVDRAVINGLGTLKFGRPPAPMGAIASFVAPANIQATIAQNASSPRWAP